LASKQLSRIARLAGTCADDNATFTPQDAAGLRHGQSKMNANVHRGSVMERRVISMTPQYPTQERVDPVRMGQNVDAASHDNKNNGGVARVSNDFASFAYQVESIRDLLHLKAWWPPFYV
jgi:hypothetical protein